MFDEISEFNEEKPVQVILRLLPSEVAKIDALAYQLKTKSRNHAMKILIASARVGHVAKIDVLLPVEESSAEWVASETATA